jgi:CSLREA domain-containing protein
MRIRTGVVLAASVALAAAANAHAATFTVTRLDDPAPGACDSDCSLREAVRAANAGSGGDTISIPAGHIRLRIAGPGEDAGATGDLDLTKSVTIAGSGARATVIDADGGDRVFDIKTGVTALISDVTLTGGFVDGNGGGIASAGLLTLLRDTVSGNHALLASNGNGGGIDSSGTLTLTQTEVSGNGAYNGGGINFGGALSLTNSTVSGNTAGGPGSNGGGGGISGSGGATLTATGTTIVGNSAFNGLGSGGGISASMATLGGTIVANNLAHETNQSATYADNCSIGTIATQGSNLSDTIDCNLASPSDQQNVPVLLGPLADNGGETDTHALPAASKALNSSAVCPATDQRGAARRAGVPCEVGAYEVAPPTPGGSPATSVTATSAVLDGAAESSVLLTAYRFAWTVEGTATGGTTALQWVAPKTTAHLSARLTGLAPGTTYRYELVGDNADGTGSSTPIMFTTRPDRTKPMLSLLRVAPAIFRAPKGTTVSFTLSEAATTTLRFDRVLPGVRRGKRCVARTARRRGRACTRYIPVVGSVAVVGKLGANSTRFDAKVAGKPLRPSAYRLRAAPKDGSGNVGKTVITAFRVQR